MYENVLTRSSFAARLPDRCAAISRKLGGPVVVSPPKPKSSKSTSFSNTKSQPGQATKRPIPAKPRRSLHRVLTDERERRSVSRGPGRAVSMMRSATALAVPRLKREGSEALSLSSFPTAESQLLQANRGGVLNSKRFAQREVDMSRLAPDSKAKAKKQANIEAELKEAISALKRPNRELAGKTMVETAEKRSASASHSRSKSICLLTFIASTNSIKNLKSPSEIRSSRVCRVYRSLPHRKTTGKRTCTQKIVQSHQR
jgi:DNA replication regulator SLD3